jgi:hypothetical protein
MDSTKPSGLTPDQEQMWARGFPVWITDYVAPGACPVGHYVYPPKRRTLRPTEWWLAYYQRYRLIGARLEPTERLEDRLERAVDLEAELLDLQAVAAVYDEVCQEHILTAHFKTRLYEILGFSLGWTAPELAWTFRQMKKDALPAFDVLIARFRESREIDEPAEAGPVSFPQTP